MSNQADNTNSIIHYHLPGLFEFYELYKILLEIYRSHREYFYPNCDIGSIYGAPADCIWSGGRVGFGTEKTENVLALMRDYGISSRLTFSNSLLCEEHLKDKKCNELCRLFEHNGEAESGIILHSDLLLNYISKRYPGFYFVSSTTKVITEPAKFKAELNREEFRYVVPDFRLNSSFLWQELLKSQKDKVEFLCNECCSPACSDRRACYENVSRKALGESCPDHICKSPGSEQGYLFSEVMRSRNFIGHPELERLSTEYGYSNFKIEGRGLGSALVFEMLLYYMVRPEYAIKVRELVYLDNTLDLF